MIKAGMSETQFEQWKKEWNLRIPKCSEFVCCHELGTCAILFLCSQGSIYSTYKSQKDPKECNNVSCIDCVLRYECNKRKQ